MKARVICLSLLALMSCLWTPLNAAEGSISGAVKDSAGRPLSGVNVGVLSNPTIKAVSADDGTFRLTGSYTPAAQAADPPPSPVLAKILTNSVTVTGSKDGLMPVRVLAKENSTDLQLTMYPALTGKVTLIGNLLCSTHTLGMVPAADKEHSVFMIAFDGSPGIKAEFDQIVHDYWPEGGSLDGDAARELENQFMDRLKINLDGPQFDAMWKEVKQHAYVTALTVTGDVHPDPQAKDQRWISATSFGKTTFKYPEQMVAKYKPLAMPDKPPLELKLSETVSMKCLYVPAGKFYMGCPLYQIPHWEEGPQHMVTLTKGYYLAETPLTWEQYAAITGDAAAGEGKIPQAAAGLSCKMFYNFCKMLSAKTGRKIRPPPPPNGNTPRVRASPTPPAPPMVPSASSPAIPSSPEILSPRSKPRSPMPGASTR